MGKKGEQQDELFVPYSQMRSAGHPFYRALDGVLREHGFDRYAEKLCARFYHPVMGRPGLAPGNYFRVAACRLLRGHRQRTWDRVAPGGLAEPAQFSWACRRTRRRRTIRRSRARVG